MGYISFSNLPLSYYHSKAVNDIAYTIGLSRITLIGLQYLCSRVPLFVDLHVAIHVGYDGEVVPS